MRNETRQAGHAALLLAVVATALALAGSRLISAGGDASLIWPPLGIAFALQLVWGWRGLVAVGAGLGLWVLVVGEPLALLPVALLELVAGALVASTLFRRWRRPDDTALATTTRFYLAGAVVGGAASALVGAAGFHFVGFFRDVPLLSLFLVFWVAEAMGVLVFGGLALSLALALARDGLAALRPDAGLASRWLALAPWIRQQVALHGIPAQKLCFEITESQAIVSREVAGRLIASLREMGASVSLDDFGTGLATFDYLKRFSFDYLKIDGGFVKQLSASPIDQAVVQSIVTVARSMGLLTIAEFVENDRIRQVLEGYGVGRPMPLADLFAGAGLPVAPARA